MIEAEDFDEAHLKFINASLLELRERLRELGSELLLRRGEMPSVLNSLRAELKLAKIWAHEETHNHLSYQRDRRVRAWAKELGIPFSEVPQYGVVRRLADRDGWAGTWNHRMRQSVLRAPTKIEGPSGLRLIDPGEVLLASQFRVRSFGRRNIQAGGEASATKMLSSFLNKRGVRYRSEMSSPVTADTSCSRLSAHLAFGNISMRTVFQRTADRAAALKDLKYNGEPIESTWLKSLSSFRSRLSWHCHFMQKLEDQPSIEFENFNRAYDGLREGNFNEQYFEAWCQGNTGYPMVDASMRALLDTGWINFRMRAMLVSFASYHLWLHWRKPAHYLARLFLDYEPGIHYSQMQMQSGVTGINTVRIYSPIKQAIDQDTRGIFIRKYVPELSEVPDHLLSEPSKMTSMEETFYRCKIGVDYPAPIVDHSTAYTKARDRIHKIKNLPSTKMQSKQVFQKHGSRKRRIP